MQVAVGMEAVCSGKSGDDLVRFGGLAMEELLATLCGGGQCSQWTAMTASPE